MSEQAAATTPMATIEPKDDQRRFIAEFRSPHQSCGMKIKTSASWRFRAASLALAAALGGCSDGRGFILFAPKDRPPASQRAQQPHDLACRRASQEARTAAARNAASFQTLAWT